MGGITISILLVFAIAIESKTLQITIAAALVASLINLYLHKRGLNRNTFMLVIVYVKYHFPTIPVELVLVIVVLGISIGLKNKTSSKTLIKRQ